jgi:uncharacterized membrane protein HdeD (DUF308 family)
VIQEVARYWWVLLVRGLLAIGFGIAALVWPEITVWALVIVFGVYVLIDGILDIGMAIGGSSGGARLSGGRRWWLVIMGLLGIAAGLVSFFWPSITAVALLWVIAVWAIVSGFLELFTAWRLRTELTNEWMWVLAGLLSIALGVLLLAQPRTGAVALVIWIGILAIAWGVALTIVSFQVRGMGDDMMPPAAPA